MGVYGYDTNSSNLLKIVYDTEDIRFLVPQHVAIWNRFKKWDEPAAPGGQYFEFLVNVSTPRSAGWMPFNGKVRTSRNPVDVKGKVYPRQVASTLDIEHAVMKLSQTQAQAFDKALDYRKECHVRQLGRARVLAIYGNRLGIQAYTSAANGGFGSTTIHVNGQYGYTKGDLSKVDQGAEVFNEGDPIVIDPAGSPAYATIVSRDVAAGTITVTPAAICSNGVPICFGEASDQMDYSATYNAPDGLADLFDNTENYLDVNVTSYPRWKALRYTGDVAGTKEPLDSKHINRVIMGVDVNAGMDVNLVTFNTVMMQELQSLYEQQIKYDPQKFQGGMAEVSWNLNGKEVTLFPDPAAPHNCLIGLTEKEMAKFVADEGDWMAEDGAMFKYIPGYTAYRAVWVEMWNIGTRNRRAHVLHTDIDEPFVIQE